MFVHNLRACRTPDGSYSIRTPDGAEAGVVYKYYHREAADERDRTRLLAVLPDGRRKDFDGYGFSLAINWIASA